MLVQASFVTETLAIFEDTKSGIALDVIDSSQLLLSMSVYLGKWNGWVLPLQDFGCCFIYRCQTLTVLTPMSRALAMHNYCG